ncbi:MAG: hypothetical protein AABZ58_01010 [Chloroflexota bacterium]
MQIVYDEIGEGIALAKCQKCGCMRETLETFAVQLPSGDTDVARAIARRAEAWRGQLKPEQYSCLGCGHCYPAVAQNALADVFPALAQTSLGCNFKEAEKTDNRLG